MIPVVVFRKVIDTADPLGAAGWLAAFLAALTLFVHPSVGVTYSDDCRDVREFLGNADAAMYAAKRAGKGCYKLFEPRPA